MYRSRAWLRAAVVAVCATAAWTLSVSAFATTDIPGSPMYVPGGPETLTLSEETSHAVYGVVLQAGDTFTAYSWPTGVTLDPAYQVRLFDPSVTSIHDGTPVDASDSDGVLWAKIRTPGLYHVAFSYVPGVSDSDVGMFSSHPFWVSYTAGTLTPAYGGAASLKARLLDPLATAYEDDCFVGGVRVHIERKLSTGWVDAAPATVWPLVTDQDGYTGTHQWFGYALRPPYKRTYRFAFYGWVSPIAGFGDAFGAQTTVWPKVSITKKLPAVAYRSKSFAVTGVIKPPQPIGDVVKVQAIPVDGGSLHRFTGKVVSKTSTSCSYRVSVKLDSRGAWRIRAYHPSCSRNYNTPGRWTTLTVK